MQITCNRYSAKNIANYTLSIQLSLDGLSFAIRDYLSNCYIHFEHYDDAGLKQSLQNTKERILTFLTEGKAYKKVFLIVDEPRVCSLPVDFRAKDAMQAFFAMNYDLQEDEKVVAYSSDDEAPVNAFAISTPILELFESHFPDLEIRHLTDVVLWNAKAFHALKEGHVSVSIFKEHFYMTAAKGNTVYFNNAIPYNNQNDLLFLLLNAFTQLQFDQYKTVVTINGVVDRNAQLIQEMKRFIYKVEFEEWPAAFNFSDEFFKMPPYYYSTFFMAPLCV